MRAWRNFSYKMIICKAGDQGQTIIKYASNFISSSDCNKYF